MATLPEQTATQPLTPSMEPTSSTAPARSSEPFTLFPRSVAQQSARMTSSENTVHKSLDPSDTEGPIFADEEHIPVMTSDLIINPTSLNTLSSA